MSPASREAEREGTALKWLVSLTRDRSGRACAEFRIGVRSEPSLADHGFQDMVVLAGSFYLEMARCVECELTERAPSVIRNVTFHSPVILGSNDTVVRDTPARAATSALVGRRREMAIPLRAVGRSTRSLSSGS